MDELVLQPVILTRDIDLYGDHALGRHPEQVNVWQLYDQLTGHEYVGRHRKD